MKKHIRDNYKWWESGLKNEFSTPRSKLYDSGYSFSIIKKDNPTYEMELLVELNRHIITCDSQEYLSDDTLWEIEREFSEYMHETRYISRESMIDNFIVGTTQIPYLEFMTTTENIRKIFNSLKTSNTYGMFVYEKNKEYTNSKMKEMYSTDSKQFNLGDKVLALTYHKTRKPIYDEYTKQWGDWIVPTIFQEKLYSKGVYFKNRRTKDFKFPDNIAVGFIVGGKCMNTLFMELLNVFL